MIWSLDQKKSVTIESLPNSFDQYFSHASVFMVLDQSMYQSIQNPLSPGVFSVAAAAIATIAAHVGVGPLHKIGNVFFVHRFTHDGFYTAGIGVGFAETIGSGHHVQ